MFMCITYLLMTSRAYIHCFYVEKMIRKREKWGPKTSIEIFEIASGKILGGFRLGFFWLWPHLISFSFVVMLKFQSVFIGDFEFFSQKFVSRYWTTKPFGNGLLYRLHEMLGKFCFALMIYVRHLLRDHNERLKLIWVGH